VVPDYASTHSGYYDALATSLSNYNTSIIGLASDYRRERTL
jgi:hypothetical protein